MADVDDNNPPQPEEEQGLRHRRHHNNEVEEEEEPPIHEEEVAPAPPPPQEEEERSCMRRYCCCCCCRSRRHGNEGEATSGKCCSTWMKYSLASIIAAGIMIHHAFETKKQFYPAVIYLVTSKPSISILGNLAFVLLISSAKVFQAIMLGSLYPLEVERATEVLRFSVLDTCLALTLFREDLSYRVVTLFAFLLLSKSFHSLADARMDSHEQHDSRIAMMQEDPQTHDSRHTKCGHVCFVALLVTLFAVDLGLSLVFSYRVAEEGPSVAILFAFEYIVMLLSIVLVAYRYVLYHVAHRIEARTEGAWVNKNLYLMYGRLFISMIKLLVLLTYFTILTAFITFPIMIVRDLFYAFRAVRTELQNLVATRRLRRQITERFMRPTQEEIDDCGGLDIISHLELQPESSIKLPCNHIFREDALLSWWERQQTCPVCRYDVNQPEPPTYVEERERRRRLRNNAQHQDEPTPVQQRAAAADQPNVTGNAGDGERAAQAQANQETDALAPRRVETQETEEAGAAVTGAATDTSARATEPIRTSLGRTAVHEHSTDLTASMAAPVHAREIDSSRREKEKTSKKDKSKRSRRKEKKRSKKRHSKRKHRSSSTESSSSSSPTGFDFYGYPQMCMPFMPPPPPPPDFYGMNYWQSPHSPYWNSQSQGAMETPPAGSHSAAASASTASSNSRQQYHAQFAGAYAHPYMFHPPSFGGGPRGYPSGSFNHRQGSEPNAETGGMPPFWPPPPPWMQPPSMQSPQMQGGIAASAFQSGYLHSNGQTQPSSRVMVSPDIASGRADLQQPVTDKATEFKEACTRGDLERARELLDREEVGANADEGYPLINACEGGHLEVVKLLHDRGADLNVQDGLPLFEARLSGHTEVVKYLEEALGVGHSDTAATASATSTNVTWTASATTTSSSSPSASQDEIRKRRLQALSGNVTSQSY
eukprot:gb/GECG01007486.1/.p1 GENE.gb/GECG01007486.1/~~gb/GECG01007486.1/.p1  ORF type:complete len:936 (+),score=123.67 gb/GECG01007486.1/:1-2808(+)